MKRQIIAQLQKFGLKLSQALRLIGMPKSSFFYRPKRPEKDRAPRKIKDLAFRYPSFGYRRIWALLRKEGLCVNLKRVRRIYKELHLELPVFKPKRRSRKATKDFVLTQVQCPRERWSVDIMEVRCENGYRVRILNFIDDASRYFLGYKAQKSILGKDAAWFLDELCRRYGPPRELRRDDGPEFRSREFQEVLGRWRIKEVVIPPGSPYYNGQIESLHSTMEKELFRREIFRDIHELKEKLALWREYYNLRRPHSALKYQTPWEVWQKAQKATNLWEVQKQGSDLATLTLH